VNHSTLKSNMMMEGLWRTKQPSSSNGEGASQNADVVIAIMGVTGAGKSSFIACVTGRKDIKVGHELYSGKFYHESMNARS
jgi:predicted GTPase